MNEWLCDAWSFSQAGGSLKFNTPEGSFNCA